MQNEIPTDAKILHDSEGLIIHQNPKNHFVIVSLYYNADPAKRSPEWESEAKAGLTDAQWRKEYLIDYEAQFGEKVFPEISTHKTFIVCEPKTFPEGQKFFAGFDHGSRNPSSMHVYTLYDGILYSCWELYEPCKNLQDFVFKMKSCPYWDKITHIAADPSMWSNRMYKPDGSMISLYVQFYEAGIKNMIKGNNDEAGWISIVKQHWRDPSKPTFKIFNCCPNQIKEFAGATYEDWSNTRGMIDGSDYKETMVDANNHSLDDCKYAFNSSMTIPALEHKPFKFPIMVRRWLK